jgi:HEAT repeat protein
MRAAALAALTRLGPEVAGAHAVRLLNDPTGRVRRVAATFLAAIVREEDFPRILGVLREGNMRAKQAAVSIIARSGGWKALPPILYAISHGDEGVVRRGWDLLASWYLRSATLWERPSREALQEARRYLQAIAERRLTVPGGAQRAWKELAWYLGQREKGLEGSDI